MSRLVVDCRSNDHNDMQTTNPNLYIEPHGGYSNLTNLFLYYTIKNLIFPRDIIMGEQPARNHDL